ncbi:DUF1993 family protein [Rugamonas sp. CCM 8940]|uniref:DUF1993 domain-containing protein n=1 Tax=Rugamonas sp. CCM 8940 TaxID=2765359 RepID=UPI0018F7065A|nr:DUF1993 domain-containing protein [Rugamonas sp. CCM 8940]
MSTTLYSASVPVFEHYLYCLRQTLDVAENHQRRTGKPVLHAALAENMFGFAQQVTIACGFTLRACCPLLGIEVPALAGGDQDWPALSARIDATLAFLGQVPADPINAGEALDVQTTAGLATRRFVGRDFVLAYALPNFFFHLVTAYAILRSQGVPLGKQDFDGYHEYPAGFSFPA